MQINEQWRKIAVAISNNLLKYPIRRKLFVYSFKLVDENEKIHCRM